MRLLTAALALASVLAPCGAGAQPDLYVAHYKFNDPLLQRMNTDGTGVVELDGIIPASDWLVVGLFVDPEVGKVYWTHGGFEEGRISRANLDGSGREVLVADQTNPRGLAVDLGAGLMFWSDTQDLVLYRADLDGSERTAIVATGDQLGHPTVDPDAGMVYYGNFETGEIRRCAYDGGDDELVVAGGDDPIGIALDIAGNKVYWTDAQRQTNYVARADLDGDNFEILVDFPLASSGLVDIRIDLDARAIFWIDEITDSEKGVWTAGLRGESPHRIYESLPDFNAGALVLVEAACAVDVNGDGMVNTQDVLLFLNLWSSGEDQADWNGDGLIDTRDFLGFLNDWVAGC